MTHLPALVTLLTVLLMLWTALMVASARSRYGVKAPATSGHPDFERAFRVQMNTLEQSVLFLPVLWLAGAPYGNPMIAGILGLIWVLARLWYALAYASGAEKRHWPFMLSMTVWFVLLLLAAYGVIHAMVLQPG